jgi:pyridoxamine 5'-phosphate oxidase
MSSDSLRDRLRALPVFGDSLPEFDPDAAPDDPLDLLLAWLEQAIALPVAQPHAMSIATAGSTGVPSNRTLLLKDVTTEGLWFATMSSSPKGLELAINPRAAIVLYWREQGRQVRVTGVVRRGPRDVSDRDFLQRHPDARATVIAGNQSDPIYSQPEFEAAVASARMRVADTPDLVPEAWSAYLIEPDTVEFWQAAVDREQQRLLYTRADDEWGRQRLWP